MALQYKLHEEQVQQQLPSQLPKKPGEFVLCSFSNVHDLLFGIDAIKSFNIPICEVCSPAHIEELKTKLEINRLRIGYNILKYGCLGGLVFVSMASYAMNRDWNTMLSYKEVISMLVVAAFMVFNMVFASRLLVDKLPAIIKLPANDCRYLVIVKKGNIIPGKNVASFLQYSGSVEITQAVKQMLLA